MLTLWMPQRSDFYVSVLLISRDQHVRPCGDRAWPLENGLSAERSSSLRISLWQRSKDAEVSRLMRLTMSAVEVRNFLCKCLKQYVLLKPEHRENFWVSSRFCLIVSFLSQWSDEMREEGFSWHLWCQPIERKTAFKACFYFVKMAQSPDSNQSKRQDLNMMFRRSVFSLKKKRSDQGSEYIRNAALFRALHMLIFFFSILRLLKIPIKSFAI